MSIKILQPGFWTTIQDLGRYGSQKFGVIVGGAMDALAVRIANLLVGNDEREATIEVTMFGLEMEFLDDHLIAVTGGDLDARLDGEKLPTWRPVLVRKNQVLKFNAPISGARAYIAFSGGIQVPEVMGSKSTYIQANIGGYDGRQLQENDVICFGEKTEIGKLLMEQLEEMDSHYEWCVNYGSFYSFKKEQTIRVLQGSEFDWFDEDSKHAFTNEAYKISLNSNRMGYQLEGKKLSLRKEAELLSEGVTYGTIQVPSGGIPIILMAERQTTGGYPKIAQVVSVDLPRLAQSQPGNTINFKFISLEEAEQLLLQQMRDLELLKTGIRFKVDEFRGNTHEAE